MGYTSIKNESYEPKKVEVLYLLLKNALSINQARLYEIHVNDMLVVPKTDDLEQFKNFEEFLNEETKVVKFIIYRFHQTSSDKFFLHVNPESLALAKSKELGALPVVQSENELRVKWEKDKRYEALESENEDLRLEVELLEKALRKAEKENKLIREGKDVDLKYKAGMAFAGIVENPDVKKNFPAIEILKAFFGYKKEEEGNLSGVHDEEEEETEDVEDAGEVIHQRVLNVEEEKYLLFIKDIKTKVGATNLASIMYLLDLITATPSSIDSAIKVVKNYSLRKPKNFSEAETQTE